MSNGLSIVVALFVGVLTVHVLRTFLSVMRGDGPLGLSFGKTLASAFAISLVSTGFAALLWATAGHGAPPWDPIFLRASRPAEQGAFLTLSLVMCGLGVIYQDSLGRLTRKKSQRSLVLLTVALLSGSLAALATAPSIAWTYPQPNEDQLVVWTSGATSTSVSLYFPSEVPWEPGDTHKAVKEAPIGREDPSEIVSAPHIIVSVKGAPGGSVRVGIQVTGALDTRWIDEKGQIAFPTHHFGSTLGKMSGSRCDVGDAVVEQARSQTYGIVVKNLPLGKSGEAATELSSTKVETWTQQIGTSSYISFPSVGAAIAARDKYCFVGAGSISGDWVLPSTSDVTVADPTAGILQVGGEARRTALEHWNSARAAWVFHQPRESNESDGEQFVSPQSVAQPGRIEQPTVVYDSVPAFASEFAIDQFTGAMLAGLAVATGAEVVLLGISSAAEPIDSTASVASAEQTPARRRRRIRIQRGARFHRPAAGLRSKGPAD